MTRALALLVLLPGVAMAQMQSPPPSLHPKSWYEAHPAERRATIRVCENDASYSALPDCVNAEAADGIASLHEQQGRRQVGDKGNWIGYDPLMDPAWWADRPGMRKAQLDLCLRPPRPQDAMLRYCAAARASRT
jgi:hypothetical protein